MLLDQTCPHCAITEAAGGDCTQCARPTLPDWMHPQKRSAAQETATARLRAFRSKESPTAAPERAA